MNSAKHLGFSLSLGALLLASACGGGGGDVKIEDLGTELSSTLCDDQVKCGVFPDKATCIESIGIQLDQLIAEVESGLVSFDSAKAGECIDALGGSDCSIFDNRIGADDPACEETFVGTIALGGACFSTESCAGQARCEESNDETCTPGVCVALESVADAKVGESCAVAFCEFDLICDDSDICQGRAALGEACAGFDECVAGFICELGPDLTSGTCIKHPTTGETCDPAFGGEFVGGQLSCRKFTDFCDPSDNTCKGKLSVGTACPAGLENACVNFAECADSTCTANPRLGESCVVDSQLSCLGGLDCESGTCVAEPVTAVCTL